MSNKIDNRNRGAAIMMTFVALCILLTGLFCIVDSIMPVVAASSVIPLKCPIAGCTPTPKPTKTPTPRPTPSPTPKPTSTPSPVPTTGHNPPTPTPTPTQSSSSVSTPTPTSTSITPVPPATATTQANQTPTPTSTTQSSVGSPPPPGGGSSGGSSTGVVFTFAALAVALVAFLLYLIPRGQTSSLARLLSLVLPTSVARRFGSK